MAKIWKTRVRSLLALKDWQIPDLLAHMTLRPGTTRQTIDRALHNRGIAGIDVLEAMADALGTSTDYLLGRTNDPGQIADVATPLPTGPLIGLAQQLDELPQAMQEELIEHLSSLVATVAPLAQHAEFLELLSHLPPAREQDLLAYARRLATRRGTASDAPVVSNG